MEQIYPEHVLGSDEVEAIVPRTGDVFCVDGEPLFLERAAFHPIQDEHKDISLAVDFKSYRQETKVYRECMLRAFREAIERMDQRAEKKEQLAQERNGLLRHILNRLVPK